MGRPIVISELRPDGTLEETVLGSDLAAGQQVQHTVLPGTWFGARVGSPQDDGPLAAIQQVSSASYCLVLMLECAEHSTEFLHRLVPSLVAILLGT